MTKNQQPIEKATQNSNTIELHSIFRTIQGEGPFSGWPAVFIRLAGCNLQCPLCDTDYTSTREHVTPQEVVLRVSELQTAGLVVITGGEPLRQPAAVKQLCDSLLGAGFFVQIETNGTLPLPDGLPYQRHVGNPPSGVYIVVSPKAGKVVESTACRAVAYKYVLSYDSVDEKDGLPIRALDHTVKTQVARPPMSRQGQPVFPVYVQPCDHGNNVWDRASMHTAVRSALRFGYIFQVQTHKVAGLE